MRAFTGICTTGMIPQMLQAKMNVNSVSRNGREAQALGAHRLQDDLSSTKSTADSATFWAPVGTSFCRGRRRRTAEHDEHRDPHQEDDLVDARRRRRRRVSGHSTRWLIGGNSNPRITAARPPCAPA